MMANQVRFKMESIDYTAYDDDNDYDNLSSNQKVNKTLCLTVNTVNKTALEEQNSKQGSTQLRNDEGNQDISVNEKRRFSKNSRDLSSTSENQQMIKNNVIDCEPGVSIVKKEIFLTIYDFYNFKDNEKLPFFIVIQKFAHDGKFYDVGDVLKIEKTTLARKFSNLLFHKKNNSKSKDRYFTERLQIKTKTVLSSRRYYPLAELISSEQLPILILNRNLNTEPLALLGEKSLRVFLEILSLRTKENSFLYRLKRYHKIM